nr:uncharacterized protein LOC128674839 [Plodia interpunctella]
MITSGLFMIVLLNVLVVQICGWQYFTRFRDILMAGTHEKAISSHSEYYFGDCKREGLIFYTSTHITNIELEQKLIIRGWIDVLRIPTCILLRGYSAREHTFRATLHSFQMCVPRISYCHSKKQFKLYYYEWYIPVEDYQGGMEWDLIFYGPPSIAWQ